MLFYLQGFNVVYETLTNITYLYTLSSPSGAILQPTLTGYSPTSDAFVVFQETVCVHPQRSQHHFRLQSVKPYDSFT